jgi:hypothetical protein
LKSQFKGVKGVVDVSSFGGPTKEYQIKLDPEKLVSYGLSISQVENQIASNNTNGGGSFIEQGAQQINVQSVGLFTSVQDIENTVVKTSNGAPVKVKDIAVVEQGPKIRLGQIGRAPTGLTAKSSTIPTRLKESCCSRKALTPTPSSRESTRKSRPESTHPAQGRQDRTIPRPLQAGCLYRRNR